MAEAAVGVTRFFKVASWLSILCGIHCLLTPVLLAVLPILGAQGRFGETTETVLIFLSITIGAISIGMGVAQHRRWSLLAILAVAIAMILSGHYLAPDRFEAPMIVTGALIMAGGQFLNLRSHRDACCDHHCE
jgi:MerC mercury resistance protein.